MFDSDSPLPRSFRRLHLPAALLAALFWLAAASGPALAQASGNGADVALEGEVEMFHVDYADHRETRTDYFLVVTGTGEVLELKFQNRPPAALRPGAKVTIRGRAVGRQLWVNSVSGAAQAEEPQATEGGEAPAGGPTDEHSVITIMINIENGDGTLAWEWSAADADDLRDVLYRDPYSVDNVYLESSHGQLGYPEHLGDIVIVSTPKSTGCAYYNYASWADQAASQQGLLPHELPQPALRATDRELLRLRMVGPGAARQLRQHHDVLPLLDDPDRRGRGGP